ncbi:MAG: AarF/ABC1/UbiB kinase family protein [Bdellovibrionaceae bacterium]|nr:AarF/ABC1/UbiB kinase family protein [Pseudobdellovibrionaceae bacterium]
MKSSPLARTFELAKLAARVGLKELKSNDFNSRVEQAVLIAKSLSSLKGAAMKAGQLLSLDLDNYFPPEAIEVLSQLQNAATAHPYSEIEKIIQSEIPSERRSLITSISQTPLGVASIGQVHKARYKNKDIVLKVQYSDVADSIDSDLKILKTLATSFCQMTGRKMNLDPLFTEFRTILEQELDYESEAKFQTLFLDKINKLNANTSCRYRVPMPIEELSTKRVLSMSFEKGVTLRQWLSLNPAQSDKHTLAVAILDLYFHEFFEWGLVQTDPNWGNFLVDTSSKDISICLLDFGATRQYSKDFILNYINLLDAAASNQSAKLRTLSIDFGLIDPRESEDAFKAFETMLKTAIKPFFISRAKGSPHFDFSDRNHTLESQTAVKALSDQLIYSPPPYSIIFLHRKLAGVYSILKSLNANLDISPYWEMMKDLSNREK